MLDDTKCCVCNEKATAVLRKSIIQGVDSDGTIYKTPDVWKYYCDVCYDKAKQDNETEERDIITTLIATQQG